MKVTNEDILKALGTVEDPDLKKDLVTLNMIKDISVTDTKVKFTVVLTTPACPMKELIRTECLNAVGKVVGEEVEIDITMSADVTSIKSLTPTLPKVKNVIAVASGKGGVGKSTVTSNLAVSLAATGAKVGIIDADIFGPSVPVMFGEELTKPAIMQEDDKNFIIPIEKYGVKLISIGFLTDPNQAIVWRGPMASSALRQFIGDCKWGDLDYLLIDLPPGTSDIHLTLVQSIPITGAVIVTTPQKVAITDAQKGLAMFQQDQVNVPILGVVENMAYFTPPELPENKYYIFGEGGGKAFAEKHNVPFLGEIPIVQQIRENGDKGTPSALADDVSGEAFLKLAEKVAQQVAIGNANHQKSTVVEIKN